MMKAILVFIDGTICDASQRYHLGIGTPEIYRREEVPEGYRRARKRAVPAGTRSTLRTRVHRRAAIPTSYFIDRDGKIQAFYVGSISEGQLDRYLQDIGVGE